MRRSRRHVPAAPVWLVALLAATVGHVGCANDYSDFKFPRKRESDNAGAAGTDAGTPPADGGDAGEKG